VQATIYNLAGEEVEQIELDDAIFGIEPNHAVVHQAVLRQQANARRGTHDTKTRADVRGGGKKPWRQKGTGRARQGSTRSPQWRHGGVVFGPHPRSYEQDMTRKMRRLAIRSVLSGKMADGQLVLVDTFETLEPRTKAMSMALNSLNIGDKKALIFTTGGETTLRQAAGNLPNVKMLSAHLLSVVDMLTHDFVVLPKDALDVVTGILGTTGGRAKLTLRGVARPSTNGKTDVEAETAMPTAQAEATTEAASEEPAAEARPSASRRKSEAEPPTIVAGNVVIATVHYQGEEYVQLRNDNDLPVDLGGWTLRDKKDEAQSMTFPEGTELKPGSTVKVFTEPGHRLSFNSKSAIWNDAGDIAVLLDPDGKEVSRFAYGKYAEESETEGSDK
jgi:large subunit ribosomal protein L4